MTKSVNKGVIKEFYDEVKKHLIEEARKKENMTISGAEIRYLIRDMVERYNLNRQELGYLFGILRNSDFEHIEKHTDRPLYSKEQLYKLRMS